MSFLTMRYCLILKKIAFQKFRLFNSNSYPKVLRIWFNINQKLILCYDVESTFDKFELTKIQHCVPVCSVEGVATDLWLQCFFQSLLRNASRLVRPYYLELVDRKTLRN